MNKMARKGTLGLSMHANPFPLGFEEGTPATGQLVM